MVRRRKRFKKANSSKFEVDEVKSIGHIEKVDYFSSLNDDSVYEICYRLSLDELCALSQTCIKFQKNAEDHVRRVFPELFSGQITIIKENEVIKVLLKEREQYKKCFSRLFKHIEFLLEAGDMDEQWLQFMEVNCCKNIKSVKFSWSGRVSWSKPFLNGIKDFISNVETVSIGRIIPANINLNEIFKFLPLVKTFKIDNWPTKTSEKMHYEKQIVLPNIEHSKLEIFEYCTLHPSIDDLKKFFRRNTTIKRFTCRLKDRCKLHVKQILAAVIETNIEELFIKTTMFPYDDYTLVDFSWIQNELKMLDERENFRRLELKGACNHFTNLSKLPSLKSLTGVHLFTSVTGQSKWELIYRSKFNFFSNLKILQIYGEITVTFAENVSRMLPHLEELHYIDISGADELQPIIGPFVLHTPKLAKLFISSQHAYTEYLNVASLSAERKKLKNATKLVIYYAVDCKECFKSIRAFLIDEEFVSTKEAEILYSNNLYDPDPNPLFGYKIAYES